MADPSVFSQGGMTLNRILRGLLPTAVAVLGIEVAHSLSDFVPWTYNFGRSPVAVAANSPGTGGLSLTDESTHQADGTSDIVATNIRPFSSAPRGTPDKFTNAAYTLTLFLMDNVSGQSTFLNFKGVFNGFISATSANVTTTFLAPLIQTVKLGTNTF